MVNLANQPEVHSKAFTNCLGCGQLCQHFSSKCRECRKHTCKTCKTKFTINRQSPSHDNCARCFRAIQRKVKSGYE